MVGERRLKVGLIGAGGFANAALVPSMRFAPIDLVAVCDTDAARADATAQLTRSGRAYTKTSEMYASEQLDAVVMAVGPTIYPTLAAEAIAADVHVFVEKPPAVEVSLAEGMKRAAADRGVQLGVGFMKRFATGYRMAKELAATPDFGRITHVSARISTGVWTPAWSKTLTPTAFVLDHSVHFTDLVQFFGGPVQWVCAAHSSSGADRFGFAVAMGFAGGASGVLEISNFESRGVPNERMQIMGDKGQSVSIENVTRVTLGRDAEPMVAGRHFDPEHDRVTWEPNMTNISAENSSLVHMGYVGEMRNLAQSLLAGEPLSPNIDNGIAALKLAHAIIESNGRRIDLA